MAYIGKSPTGTGVRSRYYYTATGGETSLSGADDNSNTLLYSDGNYVDVSLNGIALVAGTDYNTSTANTIGGLSALSASDIVEVVVYDIFGIADTVSAKDGGTFSGNVAMGGTLSVTGASTLTGTLSVDTINEKTTGNGVNIPGHVVQVVQGTKSEAQLSTANDTDTGTGVTASITPSSSSNKVLVTAYIGGPYRNVSGANAGYDIYRGGVSSGTKIGSSVSTYGAARVLGTSDTGSLTIITLDSPATTSSVSYEISFKNATGTTGNSYVSVTSEPTYIILMEIAQ